MERLAELEDWLRLMRSQLWHATVATQARRRESERQWRREHGMPPLPELLSRARPGGESHQTVEPPDCSGGQAA